MKVEMLRMMTRDCCDGIRVIYLDMEVLDQDEYQDEDETLSLGTNVCKHYRP